MAERPGGSVSARPLHLFLILDTSGSMADDGKIQALNHAIRETVPHLRDVAASNPHARLLVRVVAFSTGARWHVADPTPIESFSWTDLQPGGWTDIGAALTLVSEQLQVPPMENRSFPPVLVLVSDGQATDDFDAGLSRLLGQPWGARAVRAAIAVGRDADTKMLKRFASDPDNAPLSAHSPQLLARMIKFASTTAARAASTGVPAGGAVNIPVATDPSELTW